MKDWSKIVSDIERFYHRFDAFIILHGTDTMVYTASALSFMLENLGKPVILTGSQVPFSEVRNDAVENLLGALTIAGHFMIPEVSLATGEGGEVNWPDVMRPNAIQRFKAHKNMDCNVATLRLFPGITTAAIQAFLSPHIRGVVLETYGAGNAPDDRADLLAAFKEASDRGVIIVNVTQCFKGTVSDIYATARGLSEAGVVSGHDMTSECALTKLSFLLGLGLSPVECRVHMSRNLRGELTVPMPRQVPFLYNTSAKPATYIQFLARQILEDNYTSHHDHMADSLGRLTPGTLINAKQAATHASSSSLHIMTTQERDLLWRSFLPVMWCAAASTNDLQGMEMLLAITHNKYDVTCYDYNGKTPLHCAAREGSIPCTRFLLKQGASVHVLDNTGHTPLYFAVLSRNIGCVRLLVKADAHFNDAETKDWMQCLFGAVVKSDTEMINLLAEAGADFNHPGIEGGTALHLAVTRNQVDMVRALMSLPNINPNAKDYWGNTPLALAQKQIQLFKTTGMVYSEDIVTATEIFDILAPLTLNAQDSP
ncbi:hypothetical protein H4219_003351 [Mycoemilia scoparia]|uniref:asparaginase n=1 Tax=Mycoemilia scoparia TaxID=417184 RepID=A0A9W8DPC7_9FUNG|nr:hypothetical protein H4219_003351 [Mycoemilia scoparia]